MTPEELMAARPVPLRLVIFDCDGVLVDSERVASEVTAEALTRLGWPVDAADAMRLFVGMTLTDMVPVIEARLGRPVPADWKSSVMRELVEALAVRATAVPGAIEALRATSAMGLAWRVASNSSHDEMRVKFARLGITEMVAGRLHSHRDVGRGKPAPDLFLATAAAAGVASRDCLVIEDSAVGVRAAVAAGMDCLAYVPDGDGTALRAIGAVPFRRMEQLPALFAAARGATMDLAS